MPGGSYLTDQKKNPTQPKKPKPQTKTPHLFIWSVQQDLHPCLNTGIITALRGLRLRLFIRIFRQKTSFLTFPAHHCVPSAAGVDLKTVVGQTHGYWWFSFEKKSKQACGSATERCGVIQHEILGKASFGS